MPAPNQPRYHGYMAPADPARAAVDERLTLLRNGLLHLHKRLLRSEAALYERDVQRIASSGQLLDLVLNHPAFAWLRELSQLIVLIDETIDSGDPITAAEADRLIGKSRGLLSPAEFGNGFARRYFETFQRDPDAVLAHADMIKILNRLGRPPAAS